MILFIGCSFTWGAGLEYEYLHSERGYSVEKINKMIQSKFKLETLDYECVSYRKKHRYANLVGKKLNKNYKVLNTENGGTNKIIRNRLKNALTQYNPELIVVQFTDWTRDVDLHGLISIKDIYIENFDIGEQIRNQIKSIYKNIGDTDWIGFSWTKDLAEELISLFPENHIPIVLEDREVNSMEEMWPPREPSPHSFETRCKYNSRISDSVLGCEDDHLSSEGHKIIANSIVKKIKRMKEK